MLVAVAGCRPARPRLALPDTLPSADALLAGVVARRHAVTSLRGFARISYETAQESAGSRHVVVVAPPERFRLETLSPIGTLAVVTCDGRELAMWIRRDRRVYRGAATAASVAAYAGVPVSPADVTSMLLGLPPERTPTASATAARDDVRGLIRVHSAIDAGHQDVWFAPDTLLPVASETSLGGEAAILRLDFADYRTIAGIAMPLTIDLHLDPDGRHVGVRYEAPTLGARVDDGLFVFPSRPGIEDLPLERLAGGRT